MYGTTIRRSLLLYHKFNSKMCVSRRGARVLRPVVAVGAVPSTVVSRFFDLLVFKQPSGDAVCLTVI